MFDIGGWEFLLIAVLGIIIIGPKELPGVIRAVRVFVGRAREMTREFYSGLEEVGREVELDKVSDSIKSAADPVGRVRQHIVDTVDPDGKVKDAISYDTDWPDDELINYEDGEFAEENDIAASETRKPTQIGTEKPEKSEKPEKPA
ncbi:MAG: Sec-independent protein translocase protein TatB [Pseudomonadota bacterium]|nr:Sec-independent protein translocase protein TatB [Pseudomonadota bacterium]